MTIRLLNKSDKQQVLALDEIVFRTMDGGWTSNEFDHFFNPGTCYVFHEETKPNDIIGYIFSGQLGNCTYISNFAVKKEYEGHGIGKELMKVAMLKELECSQARSYSIKLQVLSVNKRALKFYESLGYKETSHNDIWIQMEATALPEIFKQVEVSQKKTAVASEEGMFSSSSSSSSYGSSSSSHSSGVASTSTHIDIAPTDPVILNLAFKS